LSRYPTESAHGPRARRFVTHIGAGTRLEGTERWAPFAATPQELGERVRAAGGAPLAAGDGSIRFRELLEAAGIRVEPDDSASHVVSALQVCRLAAGVPAKEPGSVLPEYLRPPDAKPRSQ